MKTSILLYLISVCAASTSALDESPNRLSNIRRATGQIRSKAASSLSASSKQRASLPSGDHGAGSRLSSAASTAAPSAYSPKLQKSQKSQKTTTKDAASDNDVSASSALTAAGVQPNTYKDPTGKVLNVLGVGDSYTAGIGSNGKPDYISSSFDCLRFNSAYPPQLINSQDWKSFNDDQPTLTFGACSGATSKDMVAKQLKQGDPRPLEYTSIGKPDIAVLTIGGNDVGFQTRNNNEQACLDKLGEAETKIKGKDLRSDINHALASLIAAGRQAGGAKPAESFQVYMTGYVQFWNDQDHGCDQVTWGWFWYKGKLTTTIRQRMNSVVDLLNGVLSDIAADFKEDGVFWVDPLPIQQKFDTHRYCEPAPQATLKEPCGADTWFWHWSCNGYLGGGEGAPGQLSSDQASYNVSDQMLKILIPDASTRAKIGPNFPPEKVDQTTFATLDSMEAAALNKTVNATTFPFTVNTMRGFHPKGTAYGVFAENFLNTIKANRKAKTDSTSAPPTSAPPAASSYAAGTCCFHIDEYDTCNDSDGQAHDLFANITLVDGSKKVIYQSKTDMPGSLGDSINNGDGFSIKSVLPNALGMTGEHEHDYIQFNYAGLSWTSGDSSNGGASCKKGGWDPRDGPVCPRGKKSLGDVPKDGIPAERQMDCCFPC